MDQVVALKESLLERTLTGLLVHPVMIGIGWHAYLLHRDDNLSRYNSTERDQYSMPGKLSPTAIKDSLLPVHVNRHPTVSRVKRVTSVHTLPRLARPQTVRTVYYIDS